MGTAAGAPAAPVGEAPVSDAAPAVSAAPQEAILNDFDNLAVGATDTPEGVAPVDTLEGALGGVSLQQPEATSASENPFAQ